MVDARKEDATHIEFWLYEPAVQGPEVTHFRVVYKEQGSPEEAKEQLVEKGNKNSNMQSSKMFGKKTLIDLL